MTLGKSINLSEFPLGKMKDEENHTCLTELLGALD